MKLGFSKSEFDYYVYYKYNNSNRYVYLLVNMDDMLIASKNKLVIQQVKKLLDKEIEMKSLGPTKKILSIEIHKERVKKKLLLTQHTYI